MEVRGRSIDRAGAQGGESETVLGVRSLFFSFFGDSIKKIRLRKWGPRSCKV